MINQVSLLNNNTVLNKVSQVKQNDALPLSKNFKNDSVDTFSKNQNLKKGPFCGIDYCAI